jgi:multidrug efflux pump subunit AcrA (membrane-fusion protein)
MKETREQRLARLEVASLKASLGRAEAGVKARDAALVEAQAEHELQMAEQGHRVEDLQAEVAALQAKVARVGDGAPGVTDEGEGGPETLDKLTADELRYYLDKLIPGEWSAADLRRRYGSPEYV